VQARELREDPREDTTTMRTVKIYIEHCDRLLPRPHHYVCPLPTVVIRTAR
jgi:hypothetical protein